MSADLSSAERADMVRRLRAAMTFKPLPIENEIYQRLLEDCTNKLSGQWETPASNQIDTMLREQGCHKVINPLHVLSHWLAEHPLYAVVKQLPHAYPPTSVDIKNALRSTVKDLTHQLDNADHEDAANLLHEYIMHIGQTREAEVRDMRNLCLMMALPPFDSLYALAPMHGKPLN